VNTTRFFPQQREELTSHRTKTFKMVSFGRVGFVVGVHVIASRYGFSSAFSGKLFWAHGLASCVGIDVSRVKVAKALASGRAGLYGFGAFLAHRIQRYFSWIDLI